MRVPSRDAVASAAFFSASVAPIGIEASTDTHEPAPDPSDVVVELDGEVVEVARRELEVELCRLVVVVSWVVVVDFAASSLSRPVSAAADFGSP